MNIDFLYSLLKNIYTQHTLLEDYIFSNDLNFVFSPSVKLKYPCIITSINDIYYEKFSTYFTLKIHILDKLLPDNSNYDLIINNCEGIANDIFFMLRNDSYINKNIVIINNNLSIINEYMSDNIAGVLMTLSLKSNYALCVTELPVNNETPYYEKFKIFGTPGNIVKISSSNILEDANISINDLLLKTDNINLNVYDKIEFLLYNNDMLIPNNFSYKKISSHNSSLERVILYSHGLNDISVNLTVKLYHNNNLISDIILNNEKIKEITFSNISISIFDEIKIVVDNNINSTFINLNCILKINN